jgi:hypothetical protein
MHPLSRAYYLAVPPALLVLGFMVHLLTPMAHPRWPFWFALSAVASGLVVRSLRPMAVKRRAWQDPRADPDGRTLLAARRAYVWAIVAGFLYFFLALVLPAVLVPDLARYFHAGQWLCLGFMPFAAAVAASRDEGWADAFFNLAAGVLPLPMLLIAGDNYSARMWIFSVVPVYAIIPGSRKFKILAAGLLALSAILFFIAARTGARGLVPLFSWLFEGRSPLYGAFTLSLQHAVYALAGPTGAGAGLIAQVGLPRPEDMALNGVPYLTLWVGTVTARLAVASLALLMVGAFFQTMLLRSPVRRAAATGLWFLVSVNLYTGILSLFFPEFLSISSGAWGLPFIGSFESSLALLLLLLLVFSGKTLPLASRWARTVPAPPTWGPPGSGAVALAGAGADRPAGLSAADGFHDGPDTGGPVPAIGLDGGPALAGPEDVPGAERATGGERLDVAPGDGARNIASGAEGLDVAPGAEGLEGASDQE